jgi:hypothetical protein
MNLVWTMMDHIDFIVLKIDPDHVPFGDIAGDQCPTDTGL